VYPISSTGEAYKKQNKTELRARNKHFWYPWTITLNKNIAVFVIKWVIILINRKSG